MKTIVLLLVLGTSSSAFAKWGKIGADDFSVASPPAHGSAADRQDLATVLQLQATRTDAECAESLDESPATFKGLFKGSSVITESEYDNMKDLMRDVAKVAVQISHAFKAQFRRPRPAAQDSRIRTCSQEWADATDYSYPSSHASAGSTLSCLLAYAYPNKAERLRAYGLRIGELRVIGGFHHPTDVEAGEMLGADICQRLLEDASFVAKLKEAAGAG